MKSEFIIIISAVRPALTTKFILLPVAIMIFRDTHIQTFKEKGRSR